MAPTSASASATRAPLAKVGFMGRPDHNEAMNRLAEAEGTSVGDQYRTAVEEHLERRQAANTRAETSELAEAVR